MITSLIHLSKIFYQTSGHKCSSKFKVNNQEIIKKQIYSATKNKKY